MAVFIPALVPIYVYQRQLCLGLCPFGGRTLEVGAGYSDTFGASIQDTADDYVDIYLIDSLWG